MNCPICNRPLRKVGSPLKLEVPDGAQQAISPPGAEVLGRGPLYREGRRIMQEVKIWTGNYASEWPPFCSTRCASTFAVDAWKSGIRPSSPLALAPPAREVRDEGEAWSSLFSMVGEVEPKQLQAPDPQPVPRPLPVLPPPIPPQPDKPVPVRHRIRSSAEQAKDRYWTPPGKEPPVPGVFYYNRIGRRLDDTPEAKEVRRQTAALARKSIGMNEDGTRKKKRLGRGKGKQAGFFAGSTERAIHDNQLTKEGWRCLSKETRDKLRHAAARAMWHEKGMVTPQRHLGSGHEAEQP